MLQVSYGQKCCISSNHLLTSSLYLLKSKNDRVIVFESSWSLDKQWSIKCHDNINRHVIYFLCRLDSEISKTSTTVCSQYRATYYYITHFEHTSINAVLFRLWKFLLNNTDKKIAARSTGTLFVFPRVKTLCMEKRKRLGET